MSQHQLLCTVSILNIRVTAFLAHATAILPGALRLHEHVNLDSRSARMRIAALTDNENVSIFVISRTNVHDSQLISLTSCYCLTLGSGLTPRINTFEVISAFLCRLHVSWSKCRRLAGSVY
jgi:hypothetical protein